ncbi:hypothetical protein SEUCBS139899_000279 [Sporothrix eucalyptigena]|uniref:BZIP transcription factor n=1 Tax=Sporothrix eucalyptigena TaxID=1812306 RepID=A0ABP0CRW7_9PEZI
MTTVLAADAGSPVLATNQTTATTTTTTTAAADSQKKDKSTDKGTTSRRTAPPADGSAPIRPLDKKRARDRRAQQALRDRTRSTIHNLSEQVTTLTRVVERQSQELSRLRAKLDGVSSENAVLRKRVAAAAANGLLTDISGSPVDGSEASASATSPHSVMSRLRPPTWKMTPLNSPPTCIADQLFLGFVTAQRQIVSSQASHTSPSVTSPTASTTSTTTTSASQPPDIAPLIDRNRRGTDEVSKVASDVVRTYAEIETLPKQIAVHFLMTHLLKWLVLLDEPSWNSVPVWLRPTLAQLTIEHPAWIDRIPWPAARDYLVAHPEISLDQFAIKYGTSLSIRWPYDPSMVVIVTPGLESEHGEDNNINDYLVNPIFEHHIANLANWDVGGAFRAAFPEMARLIDESQAQPSTQPDYLPACG